MSEQSTPLEGPDFDAGLALSDLPDGALLRGHARGEAVLLARRGDEVFALGATCTHYGGPLEQGLMVGDTVRCPWHHACFSLRSGEALRAPALNPLPCWRVEHHEGRVFVRERLPEATSNAGAVPAATPASIVIVGGGAAGNAAAEMLRRERYTGTITMFSDDDTVPYDRPNLSKNYLAGNAPEDWIPLRDAEFYRTQRIDLRLGMRVLALDTSARELRLSDGRTQRYDALLLATGAEPVRLTVPGAELPHVHCLRSLSDCRALIGQAGHARRVVVVGAGFIGLEAAAALRARGLEVHVVAPDDVPMRKVMGPEVGGFLRRLHEQHGVVFHLGTTLTQIDALGVTLADGDRVEADLVLAGVGVKPRLALAEKAGLVIDRGVTVDAFLQTSVPGIHAAGDIARWPDTTSGERIRVEHWVVAERQGQTAARNMLGRRERFDAVPFFWTEQYDCAIAYVGHAAGWDEARVDGDLEARDCTITYLRAGKKLAVATLSRDLDSLRAELAFERDAEPAQP